MKKQFIIDHKEMYSSWNFEKNNSLELYPEKITTGNDKKCWWKCEKCGHEWQTEPYHRKAGRGCPNCARNKRVHSFRNTVIMKRGSLYDDNPTLCKEWNYERNKNIFPQSISPRSSIVVWWKCEKCGHEWQASISNRNSRKNPTGCPNCSIIYQTSVPEKIVAYYVKKVFSDAVENVKIANDVNLDLDIYIPALKLGIEYDGAAWHGDIDRDRRKDDLCKLNGIHIIRLREKGCPKLDSTSTLIFIPKIRTNYKQLKKPLVELFCEIKKVYYLSFDLFIDIESDIYDIYKGILFHTTINSIINAPFFSEWNFEKNKVMPENVSIHSNKVFWWKCKYGHEWTSTVNNRTNGNGCPICSNHKLLVGFNDLGTTNPELIGEWNYEKNIIKPSEIFAKSNKKVWWKCKYGHEWQATPNSRVGAGSGCPICSNRKVLIGFNDLETTNPEILKEWDYSKNLDIMPNGLVAGSNKKVWWKCSKCGYEWKASPSVRIYGNRGCKRCAEKQIGSINATPSKRNSLGDLFPEVLVFWDFQKNELSPYELCPHSNKKVWWICKNGHSYQKKVNAQIKTNSCPICKPRCRKVVCVETNTIYDSLISAAKACGYTKSNTIWIACNDSKKTAGGYHWKYV